MNFIAIGLVFVLAVAAFIQANKKPALFITFLLAAGTFRPEFTIGSGLNLSSLWLLYLITVCLLILITRKSGGISWKMPERLSLAFLLCCLISLVWSGFGTTTPEQAMRLFLKLIYPFIVMLLAHKFVSSSQSFSTALKWMLLSSFIVSLFIGGLPYYFLPRFCYFFSQATWAYAAFSDHSAIITTLALVLWKTKGGKWYLRLAFYFCISTILLGNRTGILATGVGISVFVLLYYRRTLSVPALAGIYLLIMSALFLIPEMRNHMFFNPHEVNVHQLIVDPTSMNISNINSSGRFDMWGYLMDRFFYESPLLGAGPGTIQTFLYSPFNRFNVTHPHSVYVRLLCDVGLVGTVCYVMIFVSCITGALCLRRRHPADHPASVCAGFVICAVPAMLVIMGFDSALNCATAIAQYPFIFSGMMYGMAGLSHKAAPEYLPVNSLSREVLKGITGNSRTVF
ncbi:hypothetical protein DENIS_3182 [Desulfonema ishimotonii]|uniref:O-antigen ligase-related domain-containing protein n=1 Tax=Desulfonema ishimotonii TaxID=45657 RepID=A0A401FZ48_9BACT|nr:O-antigen ligase family protein [Desulfonema ishimotonii]GBC62213.1 hypothetical protein DENIS_3182 [Desulfonema ishimotonii]